MKKRILTFVLSLVMILSCVTVSALAVEADNTWYGDGSATEYRIYDAADLLAFAAALKAGTSFDGKTVYLCNDIALTGENNYSATNQAYPFSGTFDGQGYVISGLSTTDNDYATGLIPYVANGATIQNVTIMNSTFKGTANVSAVVGVYSASEKDAEFTMTNVHVENTTLTGTTGTAAIIGMMGNFDATGVTVEMADITFVGGSVTAEHSSGGIIGEVLNEEGNDYANGVTLTMNRIVSSSALNFTSYEYDAYHGAGAGGDCVKAGSLIGNVEGFLSVDIKNVFVGGSLAVTTKNTGSSPLVGYIKTVNTQGSTLNVQYALAAPQMTNVAMYLTTESDSWERSPTVTMANIWSDTTVGTAGGRKGNDRSGQDSYPSGSQHKVEVDNSSLLGVALFESWIVTGEESYPVPTVRPVRLIGYQSSYATDVKDANKDDETYSIRLIAALNDAFYTEAGFEGISISYVKKGETELTVVPKDAYTCKYAYKSVKGVNKAGEEEIYEATKYYADAFIALEITEIPEDVTTFTITLNAFAGKDDVTFDGITRTVQISAQ